MLFGTLDEFIEVVSEKPISNMNFTEKTYTLKYKMYYFRIKNIKSKIVISLPEFVFDYLDEYVQFFL